MKNIHMKRVACLIIHGACSNGVRKPFTTSVRWTKCERENKFKFIFTPVYQGEKTNSNSLLLPVYWGEKINLNIFSLSHLVHRTSV